MAALFGSSHAFIGLDIGTSSLKLVELIDRRRRIEVATYAQANVANLLLGPKGGADETIRRLAQIITTMLDRANVSTDVVVAALPSSIVFSAVITMPALAEKDMERAVHFRARDVVPANLDEMIIGWSRVGEQPHMEGEQALTGSAVVPPNVPTKPAAANGPGAIPIFLTAAPKDIVNRYIRLMELLQLNLFALEVETFPLVRSLLGAPSESAMIVDIGDRVTTYHVIDGGAARVSHSIDYGGHDITDAVAAALQLTSAAAEEQKVQFGLTGQAPAATHEAITRATRKLLEQGQQLLQLYAAKSSRSINKTVLIGGGANLRGLDAAWSEFVGHPVTVGNPWKGLTYPQELERRLKELGPSYAVTVGLAQRGFNTVY